MSFFGRVNLHDTTFNPLGLWQLQEHLSDSSGNGFHLSASAGIQRYLEIRPGVRGLYLTSGSKYVHNVSGSSLFVTGNVTLEMLLVTENYAGPGAIASYDTASELEAGNCLYMLGFSASTDALEWFSEHGAGVNDVTTLARIPPQRQLCHLAVRKFGNEVQFFINGSLFGSSMFISSSTGGSTSRFFLGFDNANSCNVAVASMKVVGRALSYDEIVQEANWTVGGVFGSRVPRLPHCAFTRFNGTNEYVDCGVAGSLNFERTNSFSVSLWAKWKLNTLMILVGKMGNVVQNRGWDVHTTANGQVMMNLNSDNSTGNKIGVFTTRTGFNDGNWHHIVATYNGTSLASGCHIYVDGTDESLTINNNNLSTTIQNATAHLYLGVRLEPSIVFPLSGSLDEVGVFNKVLSQVEVTEIHRNTQFVSLLSASSVGNLAGYWRCGDEMDFPVVRELISGSNGTMTNMEFEDIYTMFG